MRTYLIGYDLNKPRENNDYADLIAKIKTLGTWWHCLDSTWIIKTNQEPAYIRDVLSPFLDKGDELLVIRVYRESAWQGFDTQCSQWLVNNLSDY